MYARKRPELKKIALLKIRENLPNFFSLLTLIDLHLLLLFCRLCCLLRMDPSLGFAQLLGIAQGNQSDKTITSKQLARKREQKREKGKVAPNVKKFLEKKEAEERRKRIEKKLELERLNEARSSADKNKINKHLKVYTIHV